MVTFRGFLWPLLRVNQSRMNPEDKWCPPTFALPKPACRHRAGREAKEMRKCENRRPGRCPNRFRRGRSTHRVP